MTDQAGAHTPDRCKGKIERGEESDYQLLKRYGHSPIHASAIVCDAKRGIPYSIKWIEIVREHFRNKDLFSESRSCEGRADG